MAALSIVQRTVRTSQLR